MVKLTYRVIASTEEIRRVEKVSVITHAYKKCEPEPED